MTVTPELTALAVITRHGADVGAHVLGRIVTLGLAAALGNPGSGHPTGARWADRVHSAHLTPSRTWRFSRPSC